MTESIKISDIKCQYVTLESLFQAYFDGRRNKRYTLDNERRLEAAGVKYIYLPRPNRTLNAPLEKTPGPIRQLLHDRGAGIEPLIGHAKQGGQMSRSRIKSEETTKSAGYASVFGFNTRQLTRYLAGEARPKIDKVASIVANDCQIVEDASMKQG